jgi:dihydrofolate reductase/thymidylate synthase
MSFSVILAATKDGGIGKNNTIPWMIPEDMKLFKTITTGKHEVGFENAVIMGRKTWESIPEKFRPLPNRLNVIITSESQSKFPENVLVCPNLDTALNKLKENKIVEDIFICGGKTLYEEALKSPLCKTLYLTEIMNDIECDVKVNPELLPPTEFHELCHSEWKKHKEVEYRFMTFYKRNENNEIDVDPTYFVSNKEN